MEKEYKLKVKHGKEFTNKYGYDEVVITKRENSDSYDFRIGPVIMDANDNRVTKMDRISEERFQELKPFFY